MPEETMSTPGDYNKVLSESLRRKDMIRTLRAEIEQLKAQYAEVAAERDEFAEALVTTGDQVDSLTAQLSAAPDELRAQLAEAQEKLRSRSHREVFDKLAKDHVNPDGMEAAWGLLGWKPESDDVDEAKMTEAISSLVAKHSVFKRPEPSADMSGAQKMPVAVARPAGPGLSRGAVPLDKAEADRASFQSLTGHGNPYRIA